MYDNKIKKIYIEFVAWWLHNHYVPHRPLVDIYCSEINFLSILVTVLQN